VRFTRKFLNLAVSFAGACTLTLSLLAAHSEDAQKQETHGIVVANMDPSVKPGDDFYGYSNGGWIKRAQKFPQIGRGWACLRALPT
jgi:hypothetical protein